ncbi:hypothetical protein A5692_11605 [Mycobacterium sp. E342]|uniref:hypothetical protein n=1 Tax=Mycobacterium sp. E342 TaxID=1834147 RepID=UPI0007FE4476|nr:hypothetical protein [Mycobacterium sp. E342]OBH35396.1 hypothetical protein A5692_11605 [Mycobacterium sp. E342]
MTGFIDPFRDPFDAPRDSSLAEEDYRPDHGNPGGSDVDREPAVDPSRFDYPGTPRQSYRSGSCQ